MRKSEGQPVAIQEQHQRRERDEAKQEVDDASTR
jgi:hypothetical protein